MTLNKPSFWNRLSLQARLMSLVCGSILIGASVVIYALTLQQAADAQQHMLDESKESLQLLSPILAKNTHERDYADIHSTLTTFINNSTDIESMEWQFLGGISIIVTRTPPEAVAPEWFGSTFKLRDVHNMVRTRIAGDHHGSLKIVISKNSAENRLWKQIVFLVRAMLLVIVVIFISIALILRTGLKTVRDLAEQATRFRQGDYSARITSHGAPELQLATQAFNDMAEQTGQLLGKLSASKRELTAQLHFTTQLIETLPIPLYYTNAEGRFVGANLAWLRLFGCDHEDCRGKSAAEVFGFNQEFAQLQQQTDDQLLKQHTNQRFEAEFVNAQNQHYQLLINKALFFNADGSTAGIIGTIVDLTELKAAEQQAQSALLDKSRAEAASETKSRFLANMSHEMRTPLTAIVGLAETLFDPQQTELDRSQSVQTIIRAGRHLSQLINDLLDLSKVEADKLELEMLPNSIVALCEEVRALGEIQAKNKEIDFRVNYQWPLPQTISTDPLRFKQILINLVNNAIKFTENGSVELDVDYQPDQRLLRVAVKDTGIGINEEQAQRLFSPFSQADASTTRKYGGTGLGLYLSKKLAGKLGGKLSLQSQPGQGSCFTLSLSLDKQPVSALLQEMPQNTFSPTQENSIPQLQGRVLLAEDNTDNQAFISYLLKKSGLKVDVASNGLQALELANTRNYALILMDMQMPVMDGISATRQLRGQGVRTPIVALTANSQQEDKQRSAEAGCEGFLNKPIDRQIFYACLQQYCQPADTAATENVVTSSLLESDPDLYDLVLKFVRNLPGMVSDLQQSLDKGEMDDFTHRVHSLKGIGGNMGYMIITEICRDIEQNIKAGQTDALGAQLALLRDIEQQIQAGLQPLSQAS